MSQSFQSLVEFSTSDLGDVRRNLRAAKVVEQLVAHSGRSIAQTCGSLSEATACYRFAGNPDVSHAALLQGPRERTAGRSRGRPVVLCPQDTTTFSFGQRDPIDGFGPVDSGLAVQGFFAHSALLVDPADGSVLGLAAQEVWARPWTAAPKGETSVARKRRTRESEHWSRVQGEVAAAFGRQPLPDGSRTPPGPDDPRIISIFDREGDIFEAMETMEDLGHGFVIRAIRERRLEEPVSDEWLSMRAVEKAPVLGSISFEVPRKPGQKTRTATLSVRGLRMSLMPPKSCGRKGASLQVGMVLIEETAPPEGIAPLCWYLLTTEPCGTLAAALLVVRYYRFRWKVEEFHMGLKTGCSIERAQFESMHSFENFLAISSVAAWRMLALRDAARSGDTSLSLEVLSEVQRTILRREFPRLGQHPTARDWMRAVAKLGGFFGRKSDGEPGWRTLWWGWRRLCTLEEGWRMALGICVDR
jgi:hypothetical protein